jgi:nucleoside-diphosphate-sugar epimerase
VKEQPIIQTFRTLHLKNMSNKTDKILVTGGTGFLGSALVNRLLSLNYKIVVFDNNFRGSKDNIESKDNNLLYFEGDIRDKESVSHACKGCNVLYHLAFVNGTKHFYETPKLVLEVGVKGALNTLEAAIENNVSKYILASSSEVYQQPENIPTKEDERLIIPDVMNKRYSYAGGKMISELLAINYLRDTNINLKIFRPHNIFGPKMGFEHVIPEIIQKLYIASEGWKNSECKLTIQGSGQETRAFCFIDDAIDQIHFIQEDEGEENIFHIGQSTERSIINLIKDIANILQLDVEILEGTLRKGGTSRRCPNIEKVIKLGYIPSDNYMSGLTETVLWYKNYFSSSINN